ncbi:hypothetical protein SKAU_G00244420 [Synaphobranchus kaupii]|uniref:Uncharacterized protein n=1 Tax=Synaphobranchus kaupii TaxID=118154 RepID=A0A9Q1IR96_SYNKA|nr:hypothetical protein SKAU_G00244420 [Synaphobranchus kaupii]
MPRSDLRPTTSFSYPAALLSAVTTPLFRGTVRPSSPPSQSRTSMALPTGLTAVVTPSPQNSLDLPSVTKTVPLFVVESTVGRMAKSASLSLISSPLPLTWFTPPLRLSATKIASSSLVGKDTFSFTATKTSSMNTELRLTSLSLSVSRSALQTPLRTGVQTSALSLSPADSMVLNVISSYSTLPLLSLDPFQTGLPTPLLPTSKTSGLVTSSAQLSVISSASAMWSKPASSSRVASSPFPVSSAGSQAVELSSWATASLAVFPPGPVQPNSTLVPFPSIQQEHLLQITLQVNSTVNIFEESFQNALTSGLLLTFLQASQLNGTRARRASLLITVTQVPSAVVVSPLAQFAGWLAAVVVLAAVCVLLASLLGVFVKKSQGKGREAQDVQKRALTPFRKGVLTDSGSHHAWFQLYLHLSSWPHEAAVVPPFCPEFF